MNRIVVTGPESTGKTWLSTRLSQYFEAPLVPEFARTYLDQINRPYEYDDLLIIAKGQVAQEQLIRSQPCYFCDTDLLVIKIWSLYKFQKVDPWIEQQLANLPTSFYLLMDVDLPWQPDPQREHPGQRQELFSLYEKALQESRHSYTTIDGSGEQRFNRALQYIQHLCKKN